MIFQKSDRTSSSSQFGVHRAADAESARRALRARDHLERKRAKERRRRERETRQSQASVQRLLVQRLIGPVALIGGFAAGVLGTPEMLNTVLLRDVALNRIEVAGAQVLAPQTLVEVARLTHGDSLARIDPAHVARALEQSPWIETARALRLPDGGLILSIVERPVVARWAPTEERASTLFDHRGEAFEGQDLEEAAALALPLVRGVEAGPTLPADALEILAALQTQPRLAAHPTDLTLVLPQPDEIGAGYVLELGRDGPRALLGQTLFRERVARLASVLESVEAEATDAHWIDLRYADRAVLQTEPASG